MGSEMCIRDRGVGYANAKLREPTYFFCGAPSSRVASVVTLLAGPPPAPVSLAGFTTSLFGLSTTFAVRMRCGIVFSVFVRLRICYSGCLVSAEAVALELNARWRMGRRSTYV